MLPTSWRRLLSLIRILLGMSCLAIAAGGLRVSLVTDTVILFAVYTIYACVGLFWRSLEDSGYPTAGSDSGFRFLFPCSHQQRLLRLLGQLRVLRLRAAGRGDAASVVEGGDRWRRRRCCWFMRAGLCTRRFLRPALIAAGILGCVLAIQREYLEERLSNASRQTVLYRYDAEKAREAERQRIAADFHDGPLQSFISFQMRLEIIRKLLLRDQTAATEELMQLQELCKSQVNELRSFVRSMRPVDVEGSLNATLRRVVEQFQKDSGIPATFRQRRISGAGRTGSLAGAAADRARGALQRAEALLGHARSGEYREVRQRAGDRDRRQRRGFPVQRKVHAG